MTDMLNKTISNIKANTASSLEEAQIARIPMLYDIFLKKLDMYTYMGYNYRVDNTKSVFLVKNLSYTKIVIPDIVFKDTMIDAVSNRDITPFMLFANGALIKWSDITIIKDIHYSYFLINKANVLAENVDMILLPTRVVYSEDNIEGNFEIGFSFNENGMLDNIGHTTFVLMCEDLIKQEFNTDIDFIPHEYKVFDSNILIFKNGLFDSTPIITNNSSNRFTITKESPTDIIRSIVFCYNIYENNSSINTSLSAKIENQEYLEQILVENTKPYLTDLKSELIMDDSNNLDQNITAIMEYDNTLLNDVYSDNSMIYSKSYTGSRIKALSVNGMINVGCQNKTKDTGLIVFINGSLYEKHNDVEYVAGRYNIPTDTILDTDNVELLYFSEYDNIIGDLVVPVEGIQLNKFMLDLSTKRMFSTTSINPDYNINQNELAQYEVGFEISDTGLLTVEPDYVGIPVQLVSDRQFHHKCYVIDSYSIGIEISNDFKFCHDMNKYMIFLNDKKIDRSNYTITITMPTRPFDRLEVYLNLIMLGGDKLDIFYIPDILIDTSVNGILGINGDITISKADIKYPLTKDTFMIFVNGKKIDPTQIQNIDSTKIKILSDVESLKNVSIIQYLQCDLFATAFQNVTSVWDSIMNSISDSEINTLMNSSSLITDVEIDFKENMVPMMSVLYEIMKRYWIIDPRDISSTSTTDSGVTGILDTKDILLDPNGTIAIDLMNG
ncbi:MAG: hypothetical protein M0P49_05175, partial [Bacilli bacterium]|nr:hypothetical protein [Bacilli bacterium]